MCIRDSSDCVNNKRASASGFAVGGGVGFGLETTVTLDASEFEDNDLDPNPANLAGSFTALSVGVRLRMPYNPRQISASIFDIFLGNAKSIGLGQTYQAGAKGLGKLPFTWTMFGIKGTSTVVNSKIENCCSK